MTRRPNIPHELFEQWLTELGKEADQSAWPFTYSEGWKNALVAVQIKFDYWRRAIGEVGEKENG